MNITEEMIKQATGKCTIIDDKYVLLKKEVPATEKEILQYMNKLLSAKKAGINIACIVDYKIPEGQDPENLIIGYLLEERASGKSIGEFAKVKDIISEVSDNPKEVVDSYLKRIEEYRTDLKDRANASQEVYDKFLEDYLKLYSFDLVPDPKPFNFFFDREKGFTIIDVNESPGNENPLDNQNLPEDIALAILGYGMPAIEIDKKLHIILPKQHVKDLVDTTTIITQKIKKSFLDKGYSLEVVEQVSNKFNNRVLHYATDCSMSEKEMFSFVSEEQSKAEFQTRKEDKGLPSWLK